MTVAATQQTTDDTADSPALARIRPWQPDPRWGVLPTATPPRYTVSLALTPELIMLCAKVRADRRVTQRDIEDAHAARISEARAIFNGGDSTKKDLAAAVHAADAERIAQEDRLEAEFGPYTYEAILAQHLEVADAENEQSCHRSVVQWQQQP